MGTATCCNESESHPTCSKSTQSESHKQIKYHGTFRQIPAHVLPASEKKHTKKEGAHQYKAGRNRVKDERKRNSKNDKEYKVLYGSKR